MNTAELEVAKLTEQLEAATVRFKQAEQSLEKMTADRDELRSERDRLFLQLHGGETGGTAQLK